jgi:hypothetical protein
MADLFLSYAREDTEQAKFLVRWLSDDGLSVWWDRDIAAGYHFRKKIEKELREATGVIVIWSPHSVESEFVIDEADEARRNEKLISIAVPGFSAEKLPLGFRNRQTICASNKERLAQALKSLGLQGRITTQSSASGKGRRDHRPQLASPAQTNPLPSGYIRFESERLGIAFAYPAEQLALDVTRHQHGLLELVNEDGEGEVAIFRAPVSHHPDIKLLQAAEAEDLISQGCRITYRAPEKEENWSDWYVLSGIAHDRRAFYYRRWLCGDRLLSFEFLFVSGRRPAYFDIIPAMTIETLEFL